MGRVGAVVTRAFTLAAVKVRVGVYEQLAIEFETRRVVAGSIKFQEAGGDNLYGFLRLVMQIYIYFQGIMQAFLVRGN